MARTEGPPVALDDFFETVQDVNLSVDDSGVPENDSDPGLDSLSAVLVDDSAAEGLLLHLPDGAFEYEAARGFTGLDVVTDKVMDATRPWPLSEDPAPQEVRNAGR
jgi:hypothetical protein